MNRRFQTGEQIGDYRILGFVGAGGMGEVYHAVHNKLNRPVAIKVLGGTANLNSTFKTRFFNEARLQASLHHPNIAALYDFQEANEQLFIFMEFVDGECLGDLTERRVFSVEDSLRVFRSIVEAIAYVHSNGIVHRDIKDQNIKMTSGGTAKLLDFGIAKDSASHNLTRAGGVIGTPNYLAPEQLEGQPSSPQTDIWALGVLLYKMLTGENPFNAEDLGGLHLQIKPTKFTAAEHHNPAVPPEVSQIVQRCLKKEIIKRYQTADELLRDVRTVLENRYGTATAPIDSGKFFKFSTDATSSPNSSNPTKRKSIVAAVVLAVLFVFGIIGLGIWAMSGADKSEVASNFSGRNTLIENLNRSNLTDAKTKSAISPQPGSKTDKVRLRVDVIEGKAQVLRDNQTIGTTPLDVETAVGEPVNLTLRREGFQDKNVRLEATSGKKIYTFSLTPK